MTINSTTPFMAKKKIEKRKFIEGIFNLQVFSSMLNHVRIESNEILKDFNIECARYEEISNSLVSYNNQKKEIDSQRELAKDTLRTRKNTNNSKIKKLLNDITSIKRIDRPRTQDKISQLVGAEKKIQEMVNNQQNKIVELATHINLLNEKIGKIGTDDTICPTCLRGIYKGDIEHIYHEKTSLEDQVVKLVHKKSIADKAKFSNQEKSGSITTSIKKLDALIYKDGLNKQEIENLKKNIENFEGGLDIISKLQQ